MTGPLVTVNSMAALGMFYLQIENATLLLNKKLLSLSYFTKLIDPINAKIEVSALG